MEHKSEAQTILAVQETPPPYTRVGLKEIGPPDEAKVSGNYEIPTLADESLASVTAIPIPDFNLIFECTDLKLAGCSEGVFAEAPSDELRDAVNDFWKLSLTFRYKTDLQKDKWTPESYLALAKNYDQDCNEFERRVQKIEIAAPLGTRFMTREEAGKILFFLNTQADRVIAKVSKIKK